MISLLDKTGIGRGEAAQILDTALKGADDGELFVEQRLSEHAVFDDGRLKSASFDEAQGFGLRVVSGETQGYSHSTELSAAAMKRAADHLPHYHRRPRLGPSPRRRRARIGNSTRPRIHPTISPSPTR